jgi:hypothetical protein
LRKLGEGRHRFVVEVVRSSSSTETESGGRVEARTVSSPAAARRASDLEDSNELDDRSGEVGSGGVEEGNRRDAERHGVVLAGAHEVREGGIDLTLERVDEVLVGGGEGSEAGLRDRLNVVVELLAGGDDSASGGEYRGRLFRAGSLEEVVDGGLEIGDGGVLDEAVGGSGHVVGVNRDGGREELRGSCEGRRVSFDEMREGKREDAPLMFLNSSLACCHLLFHSPASFSAFSLFSLSPSTSDCNSSYLSIACRTSSTRDETSPRSSSARSSDSRRRDWSSESEEELP